MKKDYTLIIFFGVTIVIMAVVLISLHLYGKSHPQEQHQGEVMPYYPYYEIPTAPPIPPVSTTTTFYNVSTVPGVLGSAVAFSGGSTDDTPSYVELPEATPINNLSAWSFSFWVYLNDTHGGTVFSKQYDGFDSEALISVGYSVSSQGGWMPGTPGKLYFHSSNRGMNASSKSILKEGRWYYVVITGDSSAIKIYINDSLDSTTLASKPASIPDGTYPTSVSLGAWITSGPADVYPGTELNGKLDEFAVFNTALSQNEIDTYYANGIGSIIPDGISNLVKVYHFDTMTTSSGVAQ